MRSVMRLLLAIAFLMLYWVLEKRVSAGYIGTIVVGYYLSRWRAIVVLVVPLLCVMEACIRAYDLKILSLGLFLVLDISVITFTGDSKKKGNDKVTWRFMEPEIREFLMKNDPSLLGKVDFLLDKYKGQEKLLLKTLKADHAETIRKEESARAQQQKLLQQQQQQKQQQQQQQQQQEQQHSRTISIHRQIHDLLLENDPGLLGSFNRIMHEYKGKEEELLHELKVEYDRFHD